MRLFTTLIVVLSAGCNSCGGAQSPDDEEPGQGQTETPPVPVGTVEGVVRIADGAEPPTWPPLQTARQPDGPALHW